jgi:hypothetical protein
MSFKGILDSSISSLASGLVGLGGFRNELKLSYGISELNSISLLRKTISNLVMPPLLPEGTYGVLRSLMSSNRLCATYNQYII